MATERLSMRQIQEILRQKWALGLSHRAVAGSLRVGLGTISSVVSRAQAAGLDWAQVQTLADEALEGRLYGRPRHAVRKGGPAAVGRFFDRVQLGARHIAGATKGEGTNRSLPIANGELLFCALPDGTRGTLPAWMTDAAACAVLTVGAPVVSLIALQELWGLLDAVAAGASDPTGASMARNMVRRSTPSGRSPSSRSSGRSR